MTIPRPAARRLLAAVFVMLTFSSGLGFYNLSVMLRALTVERDLSVALASIATAVFFVASGLGGLLIGRVLRRRDPRLVIVTGAVLGALAMMLLPMASSGVHILLLYVLFGLGFSGVSLVTASTLITRWFHERRAMAMALATTGLSFGGVTLTPLAARFIESRGLSGAAPTLAVIFLLGTTILTVRWIRPDLAASPTALAHDQPAGRLRWSELLRSRFFVLLALTYLFAMLSQVGAIAHQFNLLSLRSTGETAALGVSLLAGGSMAGRLAGGYLLGFLPMRSFAVCLTALQGVSIFLLGRAETTTTLLACSVLFGLTVGNVLMLLPLMIAEAYGPREYPTTYALANLVSTAGVAIGPACVGVLFGSFGGYEVPMTVAAAASLLAALTLGFSGRMPRPAEREPTPT